VLKLHAGFLSGFPFVRTIAVVIVLSWNMPSVFELPAPARECCTTGLDAERVNALLSCGASAATRN
jgi:hypothetical protein